MHNELEPSASDRDRVEHLFGRYEALINPLERVGIANDCRPVAHSHLCGGSCDGVERDQ
jgi:hypothetical protein